MYVTTGVYSRSAQEEIVDDRYPIVLIHSLRLSQEIRRMAHDSHRGDITRLLTDLTADYGEMVSPRRPEEVLFI